MSRNYQGEQLVAGKGSVYFGDEMSFDPPTLVQFVERRVAEDEAAVHAILNAENDYSRKWTDCGSANVDPGTGELEDVFSASDDARIAQHIIRWDPTRAIAECEAKRSIIEMHAVAESFVAFDDASQQRKFAAQVSAERAMVAMAIPYNKHADFNPEWVD